MGGSVKATNRADISREQRHCSKSSSGRQGAVSHSRRRNQVRSQTQFKPKRTLTRHNSNVCTLPAFRRAVPSADNERMAVCLVGTRWGQYLGTQLREVYSGPFFVCGRDQERTANIATSLHAQASLIGWESAVRHPDITALILAIPA